MLTMAVHRGCGARELRGVLISCVEGFERSSTKLETMFSILFAETHDDKGNDQTIERDGFHQREPDPHVFANATFCFRLASHRLDHLAEDVADAHTGPGEACCGQAHAQQCCGC